MTIGALGAVGFQPYVYNTNAVSAASMNRLSKISDDVLDKKIDYSELADESRNVNPLKKGQTLDFQGMLRMQMQRGQNNAARIMKPSQETQTEDETAQEQSREAVVAQFDRAAARTAETAAGAGAGTAGSTDMSGAEGGGNVSYQMQQALNAYGMFMTA